MADLASKAGDMKVDEFQELCDEILSSPKKQNHLKHHMNSLPQIGDSFREDYHALQTGGLDYSPGTEETFDAVARESKIYPLLEQKIKENDLKFVQEHIVESNEIDIDAKYLEIPFHQDGGRDSDDDSWYTKTYTVKRHYTALCIAVKEGMLAIVKLLIASGAKLNLCAEKELDLAQQHEHLDVFQFLLMQSITGSMGTELTHRINQMELIEGISRYYVQKASQTELEAMLKTVTSSIAERAPFSDHIVMICYEYLTAKKGEKFVDSELFKVMIETYQQIIQDTANKLQWYWLKNYFLQSSIWYKRYDGDEAEEKDDLLFNELLVRIRKETKFQTTSDLQQTLTAVRDADETNWHKMTQFDGDIAAEIRTRQPQSATYNKQQLVLATSNIPFDAVQHYNVHIFLNNMVLNAAFIDEEFQNDIQSITQQIIRQTPSLSGKVHVRRGPLKHTQRCTAKVETDYNGMEFPSARYLLDINRCALNFADVASQNLFLSQFVAFVEDSQRNQTCVRCIVRVKNGWNTEGYKAAELRDCQYTDIKLNCKLVSKQDGKQTRSVIVEVQCLLDAMSSFKVKAHNLYSVERMHEFMDNAKKLLPLMEDRTNKLFNILRMDDRKAFVKYMVVSNLNLHQLLSTQDTHKMFTLERIARLHAGKIFEFVMNQCVINGVDPMKYLLQHGRDGDIPLHTACVSGHFDMVQKVLQFEDEQYSQLCSKNDAGSTPLVYCASLSSPSTSDLDSHLSIQFNWKYVACMQTILLHFKDKQNAKEYIENECNGLSQCNGHLKDCLVNYLDGKICRSEANKMGLRLLNGAHAHIDHGHNCTTFCYDGTVQTKQPLASEGEWSKWKQTLFDKRWWDGNWSYGWKGQDTGVECHPTIKIKLLRQFGGDVSKVIDAIKARQTK